MKLLGLAGNFTTMMWRILSIIVFANRDKNLKAGDTVTFSHRLYEQLYDADYCSRNVEQSAGGLLSAGLVLSDGKVVRFFKNIMGEKRRHVFTIDEGLVRFIEIISPCRGFDCVLGFKRAYSFSFYYRFLSELDNKVIFDVDDLLKLSGEGKYIGNRDGFSWNSYKKRVIVPAINEINRDQGAVTGMFVSWEMQTALYGRKNVGVKFTVTRKDITLDFGAQSKLPEENSCSVIPSDTEKYVAVAIGNGFARNEVNELIRKFGIDNFIKSLKYTYISDSVSGIAYRHACLANGWNGEDKPLLYKFSPLPGYVLPVGVFDTYNAFLHKLPKPVLLNLMRHIGKIYINCKPVLYKMMCSQGLTLIDNKFFAMLFIEAVREHCLDNENFCRKLKDIAVKEGFSGLDFMDFDKILDGFPVGLLKKLRLYGFTDRSVLDRLKNYHSKLVEVNLDYYLKNVVHYTFTKSFGERFVKCVEENRAQYEGMLVFSAEEENDGHINIFDEDVEMDIKEAEKHNRYMDLRNKFNLFNPAVRKELIDETNRLIGNKAMTENMKEFEYWENEKTAKVLAGVLNRYINRLF